MMDNQLWQELQEYVQLHQSLILSEMIMSDPVLKQSEMIGLEEYINEKRRPSLKQILFQYIDEKGFTDAEVYKRAGIDRKHFSKIRSIKDYKPKKTTVIALSFALELTVDEAEELLDSGGFSLSESETYDLVVRFF